MNVVVNNAVFSSSILWKTAYLTYDATANEST